MEQISFLSRLKMAWRMLVDAAFARLVDAGLQALEAKAAKPALPPERVHASGLTLLAALQREGRLIDFLQQDVAGYSDEEVGAAARVVHTGCRRVLQQSLELTPAVRDPEGAPLTVPPGFDNQRIRLTGNVTGQPPFRGTITHHGWVATVIRLPEPSEALDPRVVAPAEVELK
ncbi:MAG TPA: DUF2760 domain-containing protein [Candidatus Methylomirabilis sp.]|nr:DUF2760 domain-containing protein [Candidatus Methylomirabilis sp.]